MWGRCGGGTRDEQRGDRLVPRDGGRLTLTRADGGTQDLPSKVTGLALGQGDELCLETAGGGGHGDPKTRAAKAVAADRRDGYVLDTGEV